MALGVALDRRPRDQQVGPGLHHLGGGAGGDPSVNLEVDDQPGGVDHPAGLADLGQHRGDELLSPGSRVDGHHQQVVDQVKGVGDHRQGRCRVERHPGSHPGFAELLEEPVKVSGGLGVDDHHLATGIDERSPVPLRLVHHQVGFEGQPALGTDRGHHVRAVGDPGHKGPVHDVPLDAVSARCFEVGQGLGNAALVDVQH